jgi:hypothetical protein
MVLKIIKIKMTEYKHIYIYKQNGSFQITLKVIFCQEILHSIIFFIPSVFRILSLNSKLYFLKKI